MKFKKNYLLIALILIHLILFALYIYSNPNYGDSSFHQNIIEKNNADQKINGNIPNLRGSYGFPRYIEEYPIAYPQIYYVFGTVLYPIFLDKTIYFLDLIFSTLLIVFTYLFIFKISSNKLWAGISATLISISYGMVISTGNNNLIMLFSGFLTFFFLISFLKSKNNSYLSLFFIFFLFSLGTKQLIYFFNLAIILILFLTYFNSDYKEHRKKILIGLVLVFILWLPIILFQIGTTGTVSTPAVRGWPIVDGFLQPHYLDLPEWQKEIDQKVNISLLDQKSASKYYEVNKKISTTILSPFSLFNQYFNLYNLSILPQSLRPSILPGLLILFFILGVIIFLKKYSKEFILILMILLAGFLVIIFTSRVEYYLFLPFFGSIILSAGIFSLRNSKHALILVIFILFVLSVIGSVNHILISKDFTRNTYMRTSISGGEETIKEFYSWINQNINDGDLVMVANTQDVPYYCKGTYFWDYRLLFLNEDDLLFYLPQYPNFKYVILLDYQIKEDFENWIDVPSDSKFLDFLKNSEYSSLEYEIEQFKIYKLNLPNETIK